MVYNYRKSQYFLGVTLTGFFCLGIFFVSLYKIYQGFLVPLMIVVAVLSLYTVWNTFVVKTNPSEIEITDDTIVFSSYKQNRTYPIDELYSFKVREYPSSGKMYIRVNKSSLLKGRYWIESKSFNEGNELFQRILEIEREIHPASIKTRARETNTLYNKNKRKQEKASK